MDTVKLISTILLWVCIGIYVYLIWSNAALRKKMRDNIVDLQAAKERCDNCAARLAKALDALQREGIEAALGVMNEEATE